ncbi:hypothetical protein GOBAR_AA06274 [Gossypium barbadense]|uniref:Uncharacterized protein n=1 Tax=Gossypium barbadense TaxID=3634 RepID=A0A2P5YFD0_GOSBA|nr:hypothetical protein GOBAR_AA06274 [Gossypium barbadense]
MALSFSNAKLFSTFVVDGISNVISRRGYAAASQGIVSSGIRGGAGRSAAAVVKKTGEEMSGGAKEKVSWVPDPSDGSKEAVNSLKLSDSQDIEKVSCLEATPVICGVALANNLGKINNIGRPNDRWISRRFCLKWRVSFGKVDEDQTYDQ